MPKDKGVTVKLHSKFFDEIFEPARKELEKQTGARFGQMNFTKFLAKKNIKIKLPKQKIKTNPPIKRGFKLI